MRSSRWSIWTSRIGLVALLVLTWAVVIPEGYLWTGLTAVGVILVTALALARRSILSIRPAVSPVAARGMVLRVRELSGDEGFNAQTDVYENLVEADVIDPTKVVRSALQNAASIASLRLSTEAVVCEIPTEKGESRGGGMPPEGGMY